MTGKKSIFYWLVKQPLKFAVISFLLMTLVGFGYGLISSLIPSIANSDPNSLLTILLAIAFAISAFLLWKKMPKDELDRKSFVAISNAQIFVLSVLFLASTTFLVMNANKILLKLFWMESHLTFALIMIIVAVALFYLFLCGLFLSNIYVKYQRCKALGIKPWKIIFSMPMAFGLFWIPGYLLPEKTKQQKQNTMNLPNWYNRLTNWILSNSLKTIISFLITVLISGFFIGFNSVLITIGLSIIFGIWIKIYDINKFEKSINDKYANFAIILNIVLLISLICITIYLSAPDITNVQLNISDLQSSAPISAN